MTTRSVPAGSAVSACHTMAGSRPDTSLSVRAMSRSRLIPGKTTTAAFISEHFPEKWAPVSARKCGYIVSRLIFGSTEPKISLEAERDFHPAQHRLGVEKIDGGALGAGWQLA